MERSNDRKRSGPEHKKTPKQIELDTKKKKLETKRKETAKDDSRDDDLIREQKREAAVEARRQEVYERMSPASENVSEMRELSDIADAEERRENQRGVGYDPTQ